MLIERAQYSHSLPAEELDGSIFRYCTFTDMQLDGLNTDAVFLSCQLIGLDWYWALFNACLFVDTKFEQCTFRGASFLDCRFVDCEFIDCRFEADNFKSACSFDGSAWFRGKMVGCTGLPEQATPTCG